MRFLDASLMVCVTSVLPQDKRRAVQRPGSLLSNWQGQDKPADGFLESSLHRLACAATSQLPLSRLSLALCNFLVFPAPF